jgi:hypothetical protein
MLIELYIPQLQVDKRKKFPLEKATETERK